MNNILRKYIKHSAPFGPIDSSIIKVEDKEVLKKLFDPQNKIYNILKRNPSIIIGRRGSGKTAYLHSAFIDQEFEIIEEIKTAATFSKIVNTIEEKTSASYNLSENIASFWDDIFYIALISKVVKKYDNMSIELNLIKDFAAKQGIHKELSLDKILWDIVHSISSKLDNIVGLAANFIEKEVGVNLEEAKNSLIKFLNEKNINAMILLDSLEQYPTSIQSVANTLSGLLKCVGQFNERNDRINIRLCLPAEMYHIFLDNVSTNPLKDFSNAITLHWIAGELLSVVANRLSLYLDLYFPNKYTQLNKTDQTRKDILDFLFNFLPSQINNSLGYQENTIAYILRHTQLQPRHLLIYLNEIFEIEYNVNNNGYPLISEESVRKGIEQSMHLICQEIFSGFHILAPNIGQICEACIMDIPHRFSNGYLHKVFNQIGKKSSNLDDYWEFRRMLIETGIIGQVIGETERYIIGKFEYTEPHKLVISTHDELCLHPLFSERYHCKFDKNAKAIYPYGCDPDTEDHRKWLLS